MQWKVYKFFLSLYFARKLLLPGLHLALSCLKQWFILTTLYLLFFFVYLQSAFSLYFIYFKYMIFTYVCTCLIILQIHWCILHKTWKINVYRQWSSIVNEDLLLIFYFTTKRESFIFWFKCPRKENKKRWEHQIKKSLWLESAVDFLFFFWKEKQLYFALCKKIVCM